jgi:hypothetical protein
MSEAEDLAPQIGKSRKSIVYMARGSARFSLYHPIVPEQGPVRIG